MDNKEPKIPKNVTDSKSKEAWKLISGNTAGNIIAQGALTKPPEIGLQRQPKKQLLHGGGGAAGGPDKLLKQKQKEREFKEHEGVALTKKESMPDARKFSSASDSSNLLSENRRSTLLAPLDDAGSSGSLITAGGGGEGGKSKAAGLNRNESNTSVGGGADNGSVEDQDNWDLFVGDEDQDFNVEAEDVEQPIYSMAPVDIDVNVEHDNMETSLKKMLADARTTHREKTILMDKFNLLLQALVSFQETEVELIDHLSAKRNIMDVLQSFLSNEMLIATNLTVAEEEEVPEEDVGILGTFTLGTENRVSQGEEGAGGGGGGGAAGASGGAEEEGADGGLLMSRGGVAGAAAKTFKNIQGISIDEMAGTTIRETLLVQKNKLEMQEGMKVIHILELKSLEFERTLLTMHYSKMVKPSDLQREMKELRKTVNDLQMEIVVAQQEILAVQNEANNQEKILREEESKADKMEAELNGKKASIEQNSKKPIRLSHEIEKAEHQLEKLRSHYDALCGRWMEGMEAIHVINDSIHNKQVELQELIKELAKMQNKRKQSMAENDSLTTQLENLTKKEHALIEKQTTTTDRINTMKKERKQLVEDVRKMQNKCIKGAHELSHLEHSLRIAQDGHLNARLAYEKMKSAFESVKPQETSSNWSKLTKMFLREIAVLKASLSKKLEEAAYAVENVERLQTKLNELYEAQIDAGKELQDLIRTTVRKRRERQEKSEQCIKLEAQAAKLIAEKKMQQLVLDECGRSERELYRSMDGVRKAYNKVKIERAGLINDLIQQRQKLTEQSEKIKICNNEIESYNNQILDRVREIQRVHYINLNSRLKRDSVKNEALRVVGKCRLAKTERDELALTNKTLRKEIERQKVEITEIRQRFETSIHASNKIAIKVRERTEEVCTFIEKIKAYECIILKGTAELNIRELEKVKLNSVLEEVKKHLLIVTTNQPDQQLLFAQVEELRQQFYNVSEERRTVEAELNDITNKSRIREIHHELITKRETVPLLESKVKLLEENLATRDCLSLERELILKQIDELTEDSMGKANYLKDTYADEVKELCSLRKSLYNIATQIDGMICETSIAAAQADSSEKTYNMLAAQLIQAEQKYEAGFPPTEEMETEFTRILWREEMLTRSTHHQAQLRIDKIVRKKNILTGSQIVMERLRPKTKPSLSPLAAANGGGGRSSSTCSSGDPLASFLPMRTTSTCEGRTSRVYKPSKLAKRLGQGKPIKYPHHNKTGLPYCY